MAPVSKWFWFATLLGCTPGFKKSRCTRLLKVTMSRIKLLRGRREVQVRQLRRDVAQLLQLGQEENAESRLERLWKEHSLLSAYIKTGEYCQLVKANLRNIAGQRECPMDLKEPLASLCFAASCCADLPELQEIRDIMVMKYGKDFLTSAHELLPGEHVNKLFLEAFSTKQPLEVSKKALLKGIVAEYNVVQPRKPKLPGIGGGLQKTASCNNTSHKQQSRHECGSNSESCKQDPNLNALEQEEKYKKTPKQIRHTTSMATCGEEHASLPHVEGDQDRKMSGRHKKEQKDSHFQVDTVQGGANETDFGSLPHDRHGKEKFRNRLKASKKNTRVNQAGQEDQHTSSIRMSVCEKSEPDEAASEAMHGLQENRNTANEKRHLYKEVKGFVSGQPGVQENGDFRGHAKHRENKPSNQEYLAETKPHVAIAQPWKHGYLDEALSDDCNAHQMLQQGNLYHKKHDYVEREVHTQSNGNVRSERIRPFDNVEHEKEQCRMDSNHAETKSKHHSRSNRKDRCTDEFDHEQQEKSPRRRNHHVEGGTKAKTVHRFDETLSPGEAAYGIDYWHSALISNGVLPEETEPPHADSNYGETKHKHKIRSNGKSRPDRVTNKVDNKQQESSPCKRNHQLERFEKSRPGKEAYEIENWQASPKGNGALPYYGDDTHKVHRENMHSLNKNHEIAHMLKKGRKQHVKKHHFEETQQEAWVDYNELVIPERATNRSPNSHIRADDDSKYPAMQRDRNLHSTENRPTAAQIETCWDLKDARQNGYAFEPCMNGEHLPGEHGHVRQKHRRLARKHDSNHANSTVDGPNQERIAEEVVNGRRYTNGPHIPEDDSSYVAQRERSHFPQWHHQFDPKPDVEARSLPQVHNAHGMQKEPKHPESLYEHEDLIALLSSCERVKGNSSPSRFSKPPQRPPHFPQWHHQFDRKPEGCGGSIAVEARSLPQVHNAHGMQEEQKHPESLYEHEDLIALLSSCERVKGNSSPSRFSKPPQRPPPPVPPYRVSSLPNRKPLNSPPALPQRCATLETGYVRVNQEPHVHPKLPEYEDLVASFAALRNKPARPPTH